MAKVKSQIPASLPSDERQRIEARCDLALNNLNSEESNVKQEVQRQKNAAHDKYSLNRAQQVASIQSIRQKYDQAKYGLDAKIKAEQCAMQEAVFKMGSNERQLRAYVSISAKNYLRFVLGIPR